MTYPDLCIHGADNMIGTIEVDGQTLDVYAYVDFRHVTHLCLRFGPAHTDFISPPDVEALEIDPPTDARVRAALAAYYASRRQRRSP